MSVSNVLYRFLFVMIGKIHTKVSAVIINIWKTWTAGFKKKAELTQ